VDYNKCCSATPYQFGITGIIVPYYRCENCRFIFTDLIDDWSSEEISEFIYNADYLKVDPEYLGIRAQRAADAVARVLAPCTDVRILDYGSGTGAFAEAMGTYGFKDMHSYDPFSSPARPTGTFDLITCFEVLEHAAWPVTTLAEIGEQLSGEGAILIGQSLQPDNIEEIAGRWWYLAPRNGHVSLFAHETFLVLAERTHLKYRPGDGIHAFTREHVAEPVRQSVEKLVQRRGWRARWQRAIQRIRRRLIAS
jgi:2-polyprenyl-6-hydroxyphenyl methylase/3-demethylubiquinone-9 3-methyltransferase